VSKASREHLLDESLVSLTKQRDRDLPEHEMIAEMSTSTNRPDDLVDLVVLAE
jgi:hypothetical protein